MIQAIYRPIQQWPGKPTPTGSRRRAPFKAKSVSRLDLLERELAHLAAKDIVIQAYLDRQDIRNDGWPRANAKPSSPGVILTFTNARREQFSYPCDSYLDWNDNLYAIALSLEALRAVDGYGVTRGSEQYQGFKKLEAPAEIDARTLAEHFICQHSGVNLESLRADLAGAYKLAAIKLHPDRSGQDELFKQLQEHLGVLRRPR